MSFIGHLQERRAEVKAELFNRMNNGAFHHEVLFYRDLLDQIQNIKNRMERALYKEDHG